MKTPHKHAELIKAWADGAEIQSRFVVINDTNEGHVWVDTPNPAWDFEKIYRIKPEPKPDVVHFVRITKKKRFNPVVAISSNFNWNEGKGPNYTERANAKLVFDGETDELKSVEIVK